MKVYTKYIFSLLANIFVASLLLPSAVYADGLVCVGAERSGSYMTSTRFDGNGETVSIRENDLLSIIAYVENIPNNSKVEFIWKKNGSHFQTYKARSIFDGEARNNLMAYNPPPGHYTVTVFLNGSERFSGSITLR